MRKILRSGGGETPDRQLDRVAQQCGRADCSRPASARLMLDMANRVVSIDMEIDEVGAGMLCYQHAERVVVPRGWTLEDHRIINPYLFDGAPYDAAVENADLDGHNDTDTDVIEGEQPLSRKERKRRKLLQTEASSESAGKLDLSGSYDLPEQYQRDQADSDDESLGVAADRSTSPLLSRAFDMSRTRGKVPIQPPANL
jgi:hypothetical protein